MRRRVTVVTVWPDCADRYASVRLEPPEAEDVRCPLRHACVQRSGRMLGRRAPE